MSMEKRKFKKKERKLQKNHGKIIFSVSGTEDHFHSYKAMIPSLFLTALGMMNSTHEI